MKIIYKILFSLCSTIVCCAHSARAFAASCTLIKSTPSDMAGGITLGFNGTTCKGAAAGDYTYFNFQGFIKLSKNLDGTYNYAKLYDCNTCPNNNYIKTTKTTRVTSELTDCTYTYTACEYNELACTTNAECVTKLGAEYDRRYFNNSNGDMVAYADYPAKCGIDKKCLFKQPYNLTSYDTTTSYASCAATCTNAHYGDCATIYADREDSTNMWISGCTPCPDPKVTYTGYYLYNQVPAGGGARSETCYLQGRANATGVLTTYTDNTGAFDLTNNCYYKP